MKTSWRRLSSSSSEDVFKTSSRRLDQDEYVHLSLTFSEDIFKTSWSRPIYLSWPYVFKTSSGRLQDVLKTSARCLRDVFKTYSRLPWKISSRRFQGIPSSSFVLLNTSSRSIQHVSLYRGIYLGNNISEKFMVSVQNLRERYKLSSFSFSLYYTFSWLLTEAYLEPAPTSTMAFFCGNT